MEATKTRKEREKRFLRGLRDAREDASYSQVELAGMVGLTQESISRLENCDRGAHPSTIRKLANALGVHPRVLREDPTREVDDS